MILRLIVAVLLLALVGGGLVGFNLYRDGMIAEFFENQAPQPLPVTVVEAEPRRWAPALGAIGTVNAAQGVQLTVKTAGVVEEILFDPNDRVEAGQTLLRLDQEVQRADVEAARTQLELDRANLVRAEELQSRGVATNASLDQSRAAFQASQANLARALALLEQRQVLAPFAGTIGLPRVDLGQYIAPGDVVATLQDIDTMRVDFSLSEQQLAYVSIGQRLHVRVEGIAEAFDGRIVGIDPRVDPASRMAALRGVIDDAQGRLTPGQFVRIRIDLPPEDGVIALPRTAVVTSLYGDFVYVVRPRPDADDTLEVRQVFVEPGRRSDGLVEIRAGLEPGARVVARGQNRLTNGAPVTVDPTPRRDPGGEAEPPEAVAG